MPRSGISYPVTVADLEREIFAHTDSDSEDDILFQKKIKASSSKQGETTIDVTNSDSPSEISTSDPIFMLDRDPLDCRDQPDDTTMESKESRKSRSVQSHKQDDLDKEALIERLSEAPTELQVEEVDPYSELSTDKQILNKAMVADGFEKKDAIPPYSEGKKAMAKKRREERARTKVGWFDMKAPEMTEEMEADIEAINMRGNMTSWSGYKKSDYKKGPKFFQIATVEDSHIDYYHSRVPKKQRKQTIVDELLADAEFRKSNKKMYMKAKEKLDTRHPNKKIGKFKRK